MALFLNFILTRSDMHYTVNHYVDRLTAYVMEETRPTTMSFTDKKGDRPWNDPVPRIDDQRARQPTLKAVIFDMSAVMHVDVTSVQIFVDVRRQLSRHADPDPVWFYFANIRSPWTRRALASAGFGYAQGNVQHVFSVAAASAGPIENEKRQANSDDEESQVSSAARDDKLPVPDDSGSKPISKWRAHMRDLKVDGKLLPIHSVDRPFFSTDVDEAMASVLLNLGVAPATAAHTPSDTPHLSPQAGPKPVPSDQDLRQAEQQVQLPPPSQPH